MNLKWIRIVNRDRKKQDKKEKKEVELNQNSKHYREEDSKKENNLKTNYNSKLVKKRKAREKGRWSKKKR